MATATPPFFSLVAAVVQRATAARGAAKGAVQWEFGVREILLQNVCRIPEKLFCEVQKLNQKAAIELTQR